ncbi:MAG TPA: hypothetical protein VMV94_07525 [Phycisphaerae bacterium]|nr:hypothetical protein [Phycisphaerae bacterium]
MSEQSNVTAALDKIETQSSLYEKLPKDLRRQLDQAIVDHDPPTYRGLFDKFKLADRNISFMAFYRYARRIRANAALIDIAQMTLPEGTDLDKILPQLVGQRLFDACFDEETSPNTLHSLAETYRLACQTDMARRRLAATLDDARRKALLKENEDSLELARRCLQPGPAGLRPGDTRG